MNNIRALIVDDSSVMRKIVERSLRQAGLEIALVLEAGNGAEALATVQNNRVDLILCDINMPVMDGLEFVKQLPGVENAKGVPVVMITTEGSEAHVVQALSAGARGYIPKQLSATSLEITHIRSDLISKIHAAAQSGRVHANVTPARKPPASLPIENGDLGSVTPAVVAIGVSTGGPRALEQILPRFPRDFTLPILIVQHMPLGFTGPFAQRLSTLCQIAVHEAVERELLHPGVAYIAPAGVHMRVVPRWSDAKPIISLDSEPERSLHTPSVDVLMKSIAQVFKHQALGVIMTGMGSDGAEGMAAIFRQGGITIGQDEASCTVYGMPRVCAELRVLTRVVPLSEIPLQILEATRYRRRA